MTQPIKVNAPVRGMTPHPGFPQGKTLDALVKARDVFSRAANEAGFKIVGKSFGAREGTDGEADIGLVIDGRAVEVRITLMSPSC